MPKTWLLRAISMIHRDAQSWYDFCAMFGHIPANVAHMPSVQLDFAEWLEGSEGGRS